MTLRSRNSSFGLGSRQRSRLASWHWRDAAEPNAEISALVSRGGRPDVVAPTLRILGGRDDVVIGLNRQAKRSSAARIGWS